MTLAQLMHISAPPMMLILAKTGMANIKVAIASHSLSERARKLQGRWSDTSPG